MKHTSNFLSSLSVRGIGSLRFRLSFFVLVACCASATAQTTAFTYQGKLADNNGNPLSGNYDLEFRLFATDTGSTAIATFQTLIVPVSNGIFTAQLDFGDCPTCFNGASRF